MAETNGNVPHNEPTLLNIEDDMRQSYLAYAMSVNIGRALPQIRDGLKPVHRRILYAMFREGLLEHRRYSRHARGAAKTYSRIAVTQNAPASLARSSSATIRTATCPCTTRSSAWRSRSPCAT